jgi:hypothetical protein
LIFLLPGRTCKCPLRDASPPPENIPASACGRPGDRGGHAASTGRTGIVTTGLPLKAGPAHARPTRRELSYFVDILLLRPPRARMLADAAGDPPPSAARRSSSWTAAPPGRPVGRPAAPLARPSLRSTAIRPRRMRRTRAATFATGLSHRLIAPRPPRSPAAGGAYGKPTRALVMDRAKPVHAQISRAAVRAPRVQWHGERERTTVKGASGWSRPDTRDVSDQHFCCSGALSGVAGDGFEPTKVGLRRRLYRAHAHPLTSPIAPIAALIPRGGLEPPETVAPRHCPQSGPSRLPYRWTTASKR